MVSHLSGGCYLCNFRLFQFNYAKGEDVKKGFESIRDFTLGGLVPPLELSATDHEGGGWVQIFQVKGGKFVKETDWFRGYPEVLARLLKAAE